MPSHTIAAVRRWIAKSDQQESGLRRGQRQIYRERGRQYKQRWYCNSRRYHDVATHTYAGTHTPNANLRLCLLVLRLELLLDLVDTAGDVHGLIGHTRTAETLHHRAERFLEHRCGGTVLYCAQLAD